MIFVGLLRAPKLRAKSHRNDDYQEQRGKKNPFHAYLLLGVELTGTAGSIFFEPGTMAIRNKRGNKYKVHLPYIALNIVFLQKLFLISQRYTHKSYTTSSQLLGIPE